MRFEDAYEGWTSMRLTQIDAARLRRVTAPRPIHSLSVRRVHPPRQRGIGRARP